MMTRTTTTTPDPRIATIRVAVELLRVEPDQVTELRALNVPGKWGKPHSVAGWFDDATRLAEAAVQLEDRLAPGVYVTLNPTTPALLARACNRTIEYPKTTTSDKDIARRVWLPLDFDPVRPADISSDPVEIEAARETALAAEEWLAGELGERPTVRAFSGNGWHLLYRIEMENTETTTATVKGLIDAVADRFSSERVSVDRTVFNPGRIWKVYGTMARKGDQVERLGRVHRRACIIEGTLDHVEL